MLVIPSSLSFALELDVKVRQSVTAEIAVTTFAFAGTLGLNRSMAVEKTVAAPMGFCSCAGGSVCPFSSSAGQQPGFHAGC